MDVLVYSRQAIESLPPHDVPHVIISITSDDEPPATLPIAAPSPDGAPGACREVLRLVFADQEPYIEDDPDERLFSAAHARAIWDVVLRHREDIERIVVHCHAGMSRSPAVAAAIARGLGQDDRPFFRQYYPNMHVYRVMVFETPKGI
jgi:predicted protein tyrosine phosphatase